MNGCFLSKQVSSCRLPYTLQIAEEASSFFRLPYLGLDFMVYNSIRLSIAVLKISKKFQQQTHISKVQAFIP